MPRIYIITILLSGITAILIEKMIEQPSEKMLILILILFVLIITNEKTAVGENLIRLR